MKVNFPEKKNKSNLPSTFLKKYSENLFNTLYIEKKANTANIFLGQNKRKIQFRFVSRGHS